MKTVHITFGERYRGYGMHPDRRVHPDVWWEVGGLREEVARAAAELLFAGYPDVHVNTRRPDEGFIRLGCRVRVEAGVNGGLLEVAS